MDHNQQEKAQLDKEDPDGRDRHCWILMPMTGTLASQQLSQWIGLSVDYQTSSSVTGEYHVNLSLKG
ncbi:hypothetical protein Y1Q_0010118 [Alligator mississippiensis]|uniref:Uncharacterized protein n=1 Tax=Alligator mississippiensis TaxID=8496 RepID=A0A151MGA2_ALLMI|nr:hypothetical protein Y1Q_0010118 [Alligator mississippiensis]